MKTYGPYEEYGDDLFTRFAQISAAVEARLADWSDDEETDDEEGGGARKGLPEKKKKKLLDPRTWERDGRLVEIAGKLRGILGDTLFADHNLFRDQVDAALRSADLKVPAADLKLILRATSWRVETAPPVIAKAHKSGKALADPLHGRFEEMVGGRPAIVEYEPDPDLRDARQVQSYTHINPFQSSPGPKTGCDKDKVDAASGAFNVSILTRPEDRVRPSPVTAAGMREGVSILTRPEDRVRRGNYYVP